MTWQPINTAPQDETRILAHDATNGATYICRRLPGYDWWEGDAGEGCTGKPTHWMPLPDPPASQNTTETP